MQAHARSRPSGADALDRSGDVRQLACSTSRPPISGPTTVAAANVAVM
jgi:hypothetical protein